MSWFNTSCLGSVLSIIGTAHAGCKRQSVIAIWQAVEICRLKWKKSQGILVIAMLVTLLWQTANAASFTGQVVRIADGDTLTLLTDDHTQYRIRLAEIDTPEKCQPWGKRAKQALAGKVFHKQVRIATSKKDRYGRWIGRVYLGDRDINAEMVREGHAWVYQRYVRDPHLFGARNPGTQGETWPMGLAERPAHAAVGMAASKTEAISLKMGDGQTK